MCNYDTFIAGFDLFLVLFNKNNTKIECQPDALLGLVFLTVTVTLALTQI